MCMFMHTYAFLLCITRCVIKTTPDLRWQLFFIGIPWSSRFHVSFEKSDVSFSVSFLVLNGKDDFKQPNQSWARVIF